METFSLWKGVGYSNFWNTMGDILIHFDMFDRFLSPFFSQRCCKTCKTSDPAPLWLMTFMSQDGLKLNLLTDVVISWLPANFRTPYPFIYVYCCVSIWPNKQSSIRNYSVVALHVCMYWPPCQGPYIGSSNVYSLNVRWYSEQMNSLFDCWIKKDRGHMSFKIVSPFYCLNADIWRWI